MHFWSLLLTWKVQSQQRDHPCRPGHTTSDHVIDISIEIDSHTQLHTYAANTSIKGPCSTPLHLLQGATLRLSILKQSFLHSAFQHIFPFCGLFHLTGFQCWQQCTVVPAPMRSEIHHCQNLPHKRIHILHILLNNLQSWKLCNPTRILCWVTDHSLQSINNISSDCPSPPAAPEIEYRTPVARTL